MTAPGEYLLNTALKWNPNGDLSTRDLHAAQALVMAADRRPFTLPETKPMTYVALIADATGRYAHVYGNTNSWDQFVDQLEDAGCEVVEDQTSDYESLAEIEEHCVTLQQLTGKESNFVAFA
jgi:hypothetical protein